MITTTLTLDPSFTSPLKGILTLACHEPCRISGIQLQLEEQIETSGEKLVYVLGSTDLKPPAILVPGTEKELSFSISFIRRPKQKTFHPRLGKIGQSMQEIQDYLVSLGSEYYLMVYVEFADEGEALVVERHAVSLNSN
jgi:hypothetical protein